MTRVRNANTRPTATSRRICCHPSTYLSRVMVFPRIEKLFVQAPGRIVHSAYGISNKLLSIDKSVRSVFILSFVFCISPRISFSYLSIFSLTPAAAWSLIFNCSFTSFFILYCSFIISSLASFLFSQINFWISSFIPLIYYRRLSSIFFNEVLNPFLRASVL